MGNERGEERDNGAVNPRLTISFRRACEGGDP